jgi:rhodanese-related sulfurtransferase
MKICSTIFFLFMMFSGISTGQNADSLKFRSVSPADFIAAYQKSQKALIVDVREFFEYKKSRLKDAVNIPSSGNLSAVADTLDRSTDYFFYCTSGFRSKRVARFFSGKGFLHVYSLDGGIAEWKKEKLPVDRKKVKR